MIHNINFAGRNSKRSQFITDWAFKQGVFKTPQCKFIVRIKDSRGHFTTVSSHDSEMEANSKYNQLTIK